MSRFARPEDEAALLDLAIACNAESTPFLTFRPDKWTAEFREGLAGANPTYFVVEQDGTVIAFLRAYMQEYRHADGCFSVPETTFVRLDKRGSRAAALLLGAFVRWSDHFGAVESLAGNSNGLFTDRTTRFLARFGFEVRGNCMRRGPLGRAG